MKKTAFLTTVLGACLTLSSAAMAAKPTAITFQENSTDATGAEYATYSVKCSNGDVKSMTAWDGRKKWCVGDVTDENCHRKQIKAAKQACK